MAIKNIIQGDCLIELKTLEDNSVDSIVTDPPYELGFMGKSWDNTGIANNPLMWAECLRVLKPGGHLLSFSGTRTYHRMASAIEDAGFEVRNQLIWAFGSGFPKSLNLSKQLSKQTGIGLCTCKEHEPMIELEYENSNNKRDNISNGDNDGLGFGEQIQDKGTNCNALEEQAQYTDISSNNTIREKSELCELSEDNNEKEQGLEKVSKSILQSGVCESISENEGHRYFTLRSGVEKTQTTSEGEGQSVSDMQNEITDGVASPSLNTIQDGGKELNGELGGAVSQLPQQDRESNGEGNIKSENDRKIKEWGIDDRFICSECRKIKTDIGGTALKPAFEPICMAMKPLSEKNYVANVLKWGTGGINIDASRVSAYIDGDNSENIVLSHKLFELRHKLHTLLFSCVADKKDCPTPASDVECVEMWKKLVDCLGDCLPCSRLYDELSHLFLKGDQVSVQQLHDALGDIDRLRTEQSSSLSSPHSDHLSSLDDFYQLILSYLNDTTLYIKKQENTARKRAIVKDTSAPFGKGYEMGGNGSELGRFPANLIHDNSEEVRECFPETKSAGGLTKNVPDSASVYGKYGVIETMKPTDSGNASRFFKSIIYQAKASKSERNKGCEGLEEKQTWASQEIRESNSFDVFESDGRPKTLNKNNHPTVKPIALMEYLIKMVTRKGGIVLDPFAGSGSTLVAAKQNGFQYIGIEMTAEYIPIIKARLND